MNERFNRRIALIMPEVRKAYGQFKAPDHIDNTGRAERMQMTAEAINAYLPADMGDEGVTNAAANVCKAVIRGHRFQTWPTVKDFRDAAAGLMREASRPVGPTMNPLFDRDGKIIPRQVAAKRIANNEPVGDEWLWGRPCLEMLEANSFGVTVEHVQTCRDRLTGAVAREYGEGPEARAILDGLAARHAEAVEVSHAQ